MTMQYDVVQSRCHIEFQRKVNQLIQLGWQPLGGVAIHGLENGCVVTYVQAMVKPEPKK